MPIRYVPRLLCLVLLLVVSVPALTRAQAGSAAENEEKARAHFRLGRAHYDNGDFAAAAVQFEDAYRISQRAALLYNIYLAYRDANDTRNAAEALRKYLLLEKDIENRGQLESRLAALDRNLAESPPPSAAAPTPAPLPLAPVAEPAPIEAPAPMEAMAPAPQARSEEGNNAVPFMLMGAGGAMVVTSVITGIMASGKSGEWEDAYTSCVKDDNCGSLSPTRLGEVESIKSSGQTLAIVTDVLLFGGLAVAGTGLVLFLMKRGGSEERPAGTSASIGCAASGCAGAVRTVF